MKVEDLDTPAALVDLDRLMVNILSLQKTLNDRDILNIPHFKTHRTLDIARMQLDSGAAGLTCQKLSEVEALSAGDAVRVLLPYNILGPSKLEKLKELSWLTSLSVTADSEETLAGLARVFNDGARPLEVLVEFDTGQGRCGVQTPEQALKLAQSIAGAKGLAFGGLLTHPHNEKSDPFVRETRSLLSKSGLELKRVSYGGTPELAALKERKELTEYRAGSYVYGDRYVLRGGTMLPQHQALTVLATVVSCPHPDRAILDAGSKALSTDLLGFKDYGLILEYPDAVLHSLSEEHGWVDLKESVQRPKIGERVSIVPNHCCVVSNLFAHVHAHRQGDLLARWDVTARGF